MSLKSIVIASSRQADVKFVEKLQAMIDHAIVLINRPEDLSRSTLEKINPEWIFFPHWSFIIQQEVFENFNCIVFHMTDLPYGRGGSPLQNLILRGHANTRISAIRCVKELDAGPIYLQESLSLLGTAEEILIRSSDIVRKMIVRIIQERPEPKPQIGEPTLFKRRKPSESNLETAALGSIESFYDFIRMLDGEGYPRAFLDLGGFRIEFFRAHREGAGIVGQFKISEKSS